MSKRYSISSIVLCLLLATGAETAVADSLELDEYEAFAGFVDIWWDETTGRMLMRVDELDSPFLYQSSLPRGIGSNDIGLDRGQLGDTKVVRFLRSGPKILLVEDNLRYRANSDNAAERQAVVESFARSVIWGFTDIDDADDSTIIDATSFFVRDSHGVAARLAAMGEGSFQVDDTRSAIDLHRTRAFPDNTEVEAVVTFVGEATGQHLPTVVPDWASLTVHVHHSFIRLPDDDYEPLPYDPRSGVIGLAYDAAGFADYAKPIGYSLAEDFGRRHRLKKVDPAAEVSEAVEPIIYYLDRGAPEPVRSALLEGARWWAQAFEAAGYKDAYRVEMLPEGVDPMDVRYNVIQWVHRSTRGWSYGSSILDPRTGEILKGHVSLGSLRVRQDYLIAEGLLAPYDDETVPPEMLEMSLARIRQLSAHEVGHTLGFEHNFAASTQDRASVMDYPFPLVRIGADGELDLSDAYDTGIGEWDKRTVLYAYQDFPEGVNRAKARAQIMHETFALGLKYVADNDSRSLSTSHPDGNLWDNGADSIAELEHLMRVREIALQRFSERNIRIGRPLSTIEEALVPIYLFHRFQIQAVGKLIGGQYFNYRIRADAQADARPVPVARQQQAIDALLATLDPAVLKLPQELAEAITPRVPNNPKSRETFSGATGVSFDVIAPARSAVALTLQVLLDPTRAARLERSAAPGFTAITSGLLNASWYADTGSGTEAQIQRQTSMQVLYALLGLAFDTSADTQVRATALAAVQELETWLAKQSTRDAAMRAHFAFARYEIARLQDNPESLELLVPAPVPPGSPIGSFAEQAGL
ncbi:MAG: zinc-dependent metalloprotease [Woeseiaceae bacterium]